MFVGSFCVILLAQYVLERYTLKEYKTAYLKLIKLYHSDKLAGLPEELRKQEEEEKAKTLNVAWGLLRRSYDKYFTCNSVIIIEYRNKKLFRYSF